jgi:hypothetical protein
MSGHEFRGRTRKSASLSTIRFPGHLHGDASIQEAGAPISHLMIGNADCLRYGDRRPLTPGSSEGDRARRGAARSDKAEASMIA